MAETKDEQQSRDMREMRAILTDVRFVRLTAVLRAAQLSGFLDTFVGKTGDQAHTFYFTRQDVLKRASFAERHALTSQARREQLAEQVAALFTTLAQVAERNPNCLNWRANPDDLAWFLSLFPASDAGGAQGLVSMLLAFGSSSDLLLTPTEAAHFAPVAESTWRRKILDGEVPGAFKKGKQWLIQASVLRAMGYENVPQGNDAGYEQVRRYSRGLNYFQNNILPAMNKQGDDQAFDGPANDRWDALDELDDLEMGEHDVNGESEEDE